MKKLRRILILFAIDIALGIAVSKWLKAQGRINSYGDLVPWDDPSR